MVSDHSLHSRRRHHAKIMELQKERKDLANLAVNFIHFGIFASILAVFGVISAAINMKSEFFHPTMRIEIDGGIIPVNTSSVSEDRLYGNLCRADTAWNTKNMREHLILWLRSLSTLPHFKGTLHLPLDNELQNILVLQYYEQVPIKHSLST